MGKILDPNLKIPDIHIKADENAVDKVQQYMNEWGYSKPIVKINAYVLDMGAISSFNINVNIFNIPTFTMVVDDYDYQIQSTITNKEDTCIIFIGTQDFYVKFQGIITKITTSPGNKRLSISGIFYVKELFEFKQESFVDTSITDILTKICTDTKLGLYIYNNSQLQIIPEYHLNPNRQQLSFIADVLDTYTDNLWCIDTFGFLHVGTLESILNKPVDTYTLNPYTNKLLDEPQEIFFTFNRSKVFNEDEDEEKYRYSIDVENLTIDTDFSLTKLTSTTSHVVYTNKFSGRILELNPEVGIEGSQAENTFTGFLNSKYPLRQERINKLLSGNSISLELKNLMFEIVPFTLVNLEIFLNQSAKLNTLEITETDGVEEVNYDSEPDVSKAKYHLDEIHSGKHFVIGYSYHYRKSRNDSPNAITQKLLLI